MGAQNALAMVPPQESDIFTADRLKMIRDKFANGAPQHEFDLFVEVCRTLNLDPLQRQVYLIPRNSKQRDGSYKKTWTIQTSIDGYRAIADRTGSYAGSDDPVFDAHRQGYDGKPANQPQTATVTVWKIVQGIRCPFTATARWDEYVQEKSPMWERMPHTMLAKCAEALALRKAFPAQLSGVYTDSEMEQAGPIARTDGRIVDVTTGEIIDAEPASPERQASRAREVERDAKRRFAEATDIDEKIAAGAVAISARETAAIVEARQVAPGAPQPAERTRDTGPGANAAHRTRPPSTEPITIRDPDSEITEKQRGMIWGTAEDKGLSRADVHALAGVASVNDLTKGAASRFIDRLLQTDGSVLQREAAKLSGQTEMPMPDDESADLDRDEQGNPLNWSQFWTECRALGVKTPADFEAKVGAKQTEYASPAAALAALKGTEQG